MALKQLVRLYFNHKQKNQAIERLGFLKKSQKHYNSNVFKV